MRVQVMPHSGVLNKMEKNHGLINCFLSQGQFFKKNSYKCIHNFLSDPAHRQTNQQTDKPR